MTLLNQNGLSSSSRVVNSHFPITAGGSKEGAGRVKVNGLDSIRGTSESHARRVTAGEIPEFDNVVAQG